MSRRPESVLVLVYTRPGVYTRQGQVLLLQRADSPTFWQSVTGGLEAGELPSDAASRELLEETGLHATLDDKMVDHQSSTLFEISGVWRKRYAAEHTHNREHLFSVQLDAEVSVQLDYGEHLASVWLPASEALERATSPTNKQAIKQIALAEQLRS